MSQTTRLGALRQRARVIAYRAMSDCRVEGRPLVRQPVLWLGEGRIVVGDEVEFGWPTSRDYHSGYCHVEAVTADALIEFGDGAQINNNAVIKSEVAVRIGPSALLGSHVTIYDSDFHDLDPARRRGGRPATAPVELGENVFVGDCVIVLKGVTIGRDSVIGAGSVVTASIPEGVIAAGNPARVIRQLSAIERKESTLVSVD